MIIDPISPQFSRLPSLHAVRCFAVAGACHNFTEAAEKLGVTQGAVSRLMKVLEDEIGQRLFERSGHEMVLTSVGASYHRDISGAIDHIARSTGRLRCSLDDAVLSINAVPTFAMRWLIPRLPAFRALNPDVPVEVTIGDGMPHPIRGRNRIFIRCGAPPFGDSSSVYLMSEEVAAVCAPSLTPTGGAFADPRDLLRHPLLRHTTRPTAWTEYLAPIGLVPPTVGNAPSFEHFFMLTEAAAAGLGIALIPLFMIEEELASGRLVQALPTIMRPPSAYHLLYDREEERTRSVRLFEAWILATAKSSVHTATR
ncbi:MAG: transcriptional regulator [Proteobacteria bacterium]|nr:transcriptional regulator [Pseudomonadota bacterium]